MAYSEAEEFQIFANRIRPIYHSLFNLAHAVTGNSTQAEYALQSAMLNSWISGDASASRHGFREGLRSGVIRAALRMGQTGEQDWNGLNISAESGDPLLFAVAQENPETQRILALRYGCGLKKRAIARLTGLDSGRVQTLLRRFDARTMRRLPVSERRRYEARMTRAVRSHLMQPSAQAPEMGSVLRSFQADAADAAHPSRLPARIVHGILLLILALFCIAAFWFIAVLMQPAVLESPASITQSMETTTQS